jgi:fructoselysine-6-P-deglycase FrlB-like protein
MTESEPVNRDELFLRDILAAPAELPAVAAAQRAVLDALPPGRLDAALAMPRRRLIGMGSSRFAAMDAAARWRLHGRDATAETASASDGSPGGPDTLAIVISSSGSTAETVAAARRHRQAGSLVLAMTSSSNSALAREAHIILPLRADTAEASGLATLSYLATVAGLLTLDRDASIDAGLDKAPAAIAAVIDSRADWLDTAADLLDTGREIHVLADGLYAGTAEQAALMLREAPRIGAFQFDTGDWLHVGLYTLLPGDGVVLITGSPADAEAADTIHARGGHVAVVGPVRTSTDALAASVAAELLAAELWLRAGR